MKNIKRKTRRRRQNRRNVIGGNPQSQICNQVFIDNFYKSISNEYNNIQRLPGLNYDYVSSKDTISLLEEMYINTLVNTPSTIDQDKPYLIPFIVYIRLFSEQNVKRNRLMTLLYLFGRELNVNNIYLNGAMEIGSKNFNQICDKIKNNTNETSPVGIKCGVLVVLPNIFKKIYAVYLKIPDFSNKFKMYFEYYKQMYRNKTMSETEKNTSLEKFIADNQLQIILDFNKNLIYLLIILQTSGEKILEYININFIQAENIKAMQESIDYSLTYLIGNTYESGRNNLSQKIKNYASQNINTINDMFGENISKNLFESNINITCKYDKNKQSIIFQVNKKSSFFLSISDGANYIQPLAIMYFEENFNIIDNNYTQTEKFRWIADKQSVNNIISCINDNSIFGFLQCIKPNEKMIPIKSNTMCDNTQNNTSVNPISPPATNVNSPLPSPVTNVNPSLSPPATNVNPSLPSPESNINPLSSPVSNNTNSYQPTSVTNINPPPPVSVPNNTITNGYNFNTNNLKQAASNVAQGLYNNPEAVGVGTTMAAVGSALGTLAYYGLIFGGKRKTQKRKKL